MSTTININTDLAEELTKLARKNGQDLSSFIEEILNEVINNTDEINSLNHSINNDIDQLFKQNNWGKEKITEWENAHFTTSNY